MAQTKRRRRRRRRELTVDSLYDILFNYWRPLLMSESFIAWVYFHSTVVGGFFTSIDT
jgi:hypothetical protein